MAEVFTGTPGKFVQIEDTIAASRLVDGEYDHLPESAFFMFGGIEEAVARPRNWRRSNRGRRFHSGSRGRLR